MAHVEKRRREQADGTLGPVRYRVRWREPDGRARTKTFVRARDANAWATHVEHGMLSGTYIDHDAGRATLEEYAEGWRKSRVWAPNTADRVESVFRLHVYPTLGSRPIGAVRPSEVQSWVKGLSRDLAPATVGVIAANLSGVFNAAVLDRAVASNPLVGIKLPEVPRSEVVPPTPEQVHLLVDAVAEDWRAAVLVGAGLGLRISECLGLTVDRIDFLRRTVRIDRQALPRTGEGVSLVPLKTRASARTIPLPDSVSIALAAHIERLGTGDHGAVFHKPDGSLVRRQVLGIALTAGLTKVNTAAKARKEPPPLPERVRFHDLRHFYASLLIASGASVKTVQRRLGHASAVETLDTYGHLWPDSEDQTRASVDDVLKRAASPPRPTGTP